MEDVFKGLPYECVWSESEQGLAGRGDGFDSAVGVMGRDDFATVFS